MSCPVAALRAELAEWGRRSAWAQALGGPDSEWDRTAFAQIFGDSGQLPDELLDDMDARVASLAYAAQQAPQTPEAKAANDRILWELRQLALVVERSPGPVFESSNVRPAIFQMRVRLLGGRALWGAGPQPPVSVAVVPEGLAQLLCYGAADTLRWTARPDPPAEATYADLKRLVMNQPAPWLWQTKGEAEERAAAGKKSKGEGKTSEAKKGKDVRRVKAGYGSRDTVAGTTIELSFHEESFRLNGYPHKRLVASTPTDPEDHLKGYGRLSNTTGTGPGVKWMKGTEYHCPMRHYYAWLRLEGSPDAFSLPFLVLSNYKNQAVDKGGERFLFETLLFQKGLVPVPTQSAAEYEPDTSWKDILKQRVNILSGLGLAFDGSAVTREAIPHQSLADLLSLKLTSFRPTNRKATAPLDSASRSHLATMLSSATRWAAGPQDGGELPFGPDGWQSMSWAGFLHKGFRRGQLEDRSADEPFSVQDYVWDLLESFYKGGPILDLWNKGLLFGLASQQDVETWLKRAPQPRQSVVVRLSNSSRGAALTVTKLNEAMEPEFKLVWPAGTFQLLRTLPGEARVLRRREGLAGEEPTPIPLPPPVTLHSGPLRGYEIPLAVLFADGPPSPSSSAAEGGQGWSGGEVGGPSLGSQTRGQTAPLEALAATLSKALAEVGLESLSPAELDACQALSDQLSRTLSPPHTDPALQDIIQYIREDMETDAEETSNTLAPLT